MTGGFPSPKARSSSSGPTRRPYDIVLFGATGFTGALTAEYLASHAPAGAPWALAGRSMTKLQELRARLAQANPGCAELDLLRADLEDASSMQALARASRVVI